MKSNDVGEILIAYIPVLHQGYLNYLQRHAGALLYLLGPDILADFPHLRKDVRALPAEVIVKLIASLGIFSSVEVLDLSKLAELQKLSTRLIMPKEDIMEEFAAKAFPHKDIQFESVFLRWDKKNTLTENLPKPDEEISVDELDLRFMREAYTQAEKSADWWRQVGGVIVKDGKVVLTAVNRHVPDEQQPYYDGDPRGNFHKGEHIDLATALHVEASLIAQAAQQGLVLDGAAMYVTTFPCPYCAKVVAYSGVKTLFYAEGYAMVDGESIMKERGVRLVKVGKRQAQAAISFQRKSYQGSV